MSIVYTTGFSPKRYLPTLGVNVLAHEVDINGDKVHMQIFDIAGQENFSIVRKRFYLGASGALAVFDLTSQISLKALSNWITEVKQYCGEDAEILVLGIPCVLVPSPNVAENHQYYNAKSLADKGAAILIEDVKVADEMPNIVFNTLSSNDQLKKLRSNALSIAKPNAAKEIAKNAVKYAEVG